VFAGRVSLPPVARVVSPSPRFRTASTVPPAALALPLLSSVAAFWPWAWLWMAPAWREANGLAFAVGRTPRRGYEDGKRRSLGEFRSGHRQLFRLSQSFVYGLPTVRVRRQLPVWSCHLISSEHVPESHAPVGYPSPAHLQ